MTTTNIDKQHSIDQNINALFASRLSLAARWGAAIFMVLAALDGIITPDNVLVFLPFRIATAAALIILALLSQRTDPGRVILQRTFAFAAVIIAALTIEFIIMKTGGHASPHYVGLVLLGLGMTGFIPAPLSFHAILSILIYGIYAVPVLIMETRIDARTFFISSTFLIATQATAMLMRYLGQKSLISELGLKYDLELQQVGLEEDISERTAQLYATIADLREVIAERRKAERELVESEAKYRLVVENAREGILIAQDGVLKFVNPFLLTMTGYTRDELLSKPFLDFIFPEDRDLVMKQHLKRLRGELPPDYLYAFRFVNRNGDARWTEMRGALAAWEGNPATVNFLNDITERRIAEQSLRESEANFRTLFEESKDVFYISTPEGKFLDINPAGVALFGYASKSELLSVDITRDLYVHPRDRKRFIDIVDETSYAKDYEVEMKRKNGDKLFVIITSTAVRNEQGRVIAFRGIIRDVTEHKKLEQQLLQSQKMEAVGQLAGGIAHDFNNILTAIVGYASMLRRKVQKDDPLRLYVEHVLEASERGAGLTHGLLAFSRKQVMSPRQIDLNEIVRKSEKLLARLIGEDIKINSVLENGELVVVADSLQIEQVLMNLATNARDAMPQGGSFTITTKRIALDERFVQQEPGLRPGNYAVMIAADTGTGMDAGMREKIFEPFFTTKEVGKGSGLGLAMAYGIIKQHNGHISVSTELGMGTSFHIYLPLASGSSMAPDVVTEHNDPAPCGSETILIAEDDRNVRDMTSSVLRECGYTVIEAENGEEAIDQFVEHKDSIDLLILDVIMPKKSGKDVYDAVKSIKPGVKVLFTSGYAADLVRTKGFIDEGLHFVQKPISMDDLQRSVRAVLDEAPPQP